MTGRTRLDPSRRRDPGHDAGLWAVVLAIMAVAGLVLLAVWLPARVIGVAPGNPMASLISLAGGEPYPSAAVPGLVLIVVVGLVVAGLVVWVVRRRRPDRKWVDERAASMARAADLAVMHGPGASADAARLGCPDTEGGPVVGRLVPTRQVLRSSMEWVQIWLMGPRAGKTTCVCIPQVVEAPGAVIATSNKRDLVDHTRGPRSEKGTVWVCDPQQIIGESPSWWWNPLSYIQGFPEAEELAKLLSAGGRPDGARVDAYFDGESENYLACLLLAAARGGYPITELLVWLSNPDDIMPVTVLDRAGLEQPRLTLNAIIGLTEKQRDGIVGGARKAMNWLQNPDVLPWVTATGPDDHRPQFDPEQFVRSTQSLYLVSREGRGSARAITAALTVATITAAERYGSRSAGGRMPVPMVVMLDEAANVVRWPDLPDLYSHFGSRGILVSTFLQSWNQGVAVWGRDGMEKLWSAANVRAVGAGIAQADFLGSLSTLVGDHDKVRRDRSGGSGGFGSGSVSTRIQRERILDAGELQRLPQGRAIMLSSAAPPALVELVHWSATEHAETIRQSEQYFTSQLSPT